MTDIDNTAVYDRYHRPLPGGGFTCERPGCTHVNGRPELLDRDLADVGQERRPRPRSAQPAPRRSKPATAWVISRPR